MIQVPAATLEKYMQPDGIERLCEQIKLPEEIAARVSHEVKTFDFSVVSDVFPLLFSVDTGKDAALAIAARIKRDPHCTRPLAVYLAAALHTGSFFRERGVPEKVFIDTMSMFTIFINEHKESFGFYGFNRDYWIFYCLSAAIFRLGALEFETRHYDGFGNFSQIKLGDPVLSVHIQSNSDLSRAALDESYQIAKDFFPTYFPEFQPVLTYCSTWLLAPVLRIFLEPGSKILNFQADYDIFKIFPDNNSHMLWLFKNIYENLDELPENTTLQRRVKSYLLAGGKIGSAAGLLKHF